MGCNLQRSLLCTKQWMLFLCLSLARFLQNQRSTWWPTTSTCLPSIQGFVHPTNCREGSHCFLSVFTNMTSDQNRNFPTWEEMIRSKFVCCAVVTQCFPMIMFNKILEWLNMVSKEVTASYQMCKPRWSHPHRQKYCAYLR